jgi:hypothetical protein
MATKVYEIDPGLKPREKYEKLNFILRQIQKSMVVGSGGVISHANLANLSYEKSGHTGFAKSYHVHQEADVTGLVADLAAKCPLVGGKVPVANLPAFTSKEIIGPLYTAGDFTVTHGLGRIPILSLILMTSPGFIYWQYGTQWDIDNLYLTASDINLTATALLI